MIYIKLANDNKIASIGFGTYLIPKNKTIEAVYNAIKLGYRHIDTAAAYENEEEIGYAIQKCIAEGIVKREDLFITSKISPHKKIGYQEAIDAIETSVAKLGLDYIDLYLIHWPNVAPGAMWKKLNAETWRGFEECYNRGLVKNLGVSNFMIHHLEELFKTAKIKPVVNQIHVSPIWQQKEVVNWCKEHDIQVCAWSPLVRFENWAGNHLGNQDYSTCDDWTADTMNELCKKYNKSKAQISLRWSIQKGIIPLAKSTHIERMEENINIFDFEISPEDMAKLDDLNARPCNPDATPDSIYNSWSMAIALGRQNYEEKSKIKIFGLTFLKKKRINDKKTKYYLFSFLPILKRIKKSENEYKYLTFFNIPLAKKIVRMKTVQNNAFLPNYNKKEENFETKKYTNYFDRLYSRMFIYDEVYDNKTYSKLHKLFFKIKAAFCHKIDISSLDVHLITACTLKCKNCSHKIPYYKPENHHVMSVEEFKKELDIILKNVDNIYNLLLLGGEPLLHKDLDKIIEYANSQNQVKRVVVVTNGTLIPSGNVVEALKKSKKTILFISSYDLNKSLKNYNPEKIKKICEENNIRCSFTQGNSWFKQPEIDLTETKASEKENNFSKCNFKYYTLWSSGKIYPCAYAKYINDETKGKYNSEFIDLNSKSINSKIFRKFFKKSYYNICECCNMKHYNEILFPAMQLDSRDEEVAAK